MRKYLCIKTQMVWHELWTQKCKLQQNNYYFFYKALKKTTTSATKCCTCKTHKKELNQLKLYNRNKINQIYNLRLCQRNKRCFSEFPKWKVNRLIWQQVRDHSLILEQQHKKLWADVWTWALGAADQLTWATDQENVCESAQREGTHKFEDDHTQELGMMRVGGAEE